MTLDCFSTDLAVFSLYCHSIRPTFSTMALALSNRLVAKTKTLKPIDPRETRIEFLMTSSNNIGKQLKEN